MRGINHWILRVRQAAKNPRATAADLMRRTASTLMPTNTEDAAASALAQVVLERFYADDVGRDYGLGRRAKVELVESFKRNTVAIPSATSWLSHVVLAHEILNLPPSVAGDVVECGTYKGASASSLSLVCRVVGRKLVICDSFEGLPDDESQATHEYPHLSVYGFYKKGMFAGPLDEVKANLERFGDLSVCQFIKGFFSESLEALSNPVAFAFLDVDLLSSMQDCLKHIWPLLVERGAIYTDDSCDMEVVRLWFDDQWWQRELGERAPGYVGSGCGLPLSPNHSPLGYARKLSAPQQSYQRVSWLYYPNAAEHDQQAPSFPSEGSS